MDLVDKIIELTDLFDDNVVTTADKIPQPEPRKEVLDREAINRFMKDNSMADGGRIGLKDGYRPGAPIDPLDPQRKISEVMDAYDRYYKGPGKKVRKIPFRKFFEIYAKENFADGGRIGFQQAGLAAQQANIQKGIEKRKFLKEEITKKIKNFEKIKNLPKEKFKINLKSLQKEFNTDESTIKKVLDDLPKNLKDKIKFSTVGKATPTKLTDVIEKLVKALDRRGMVIDGKAADTEEENDKTNVGAASQVRSINTLNKNLARATRNFNRVALGTEDAAEAAIQLKKAEDALNKALAEQNKLMGKNNQLSGSALQKKTDIARGKFAGSGPGVFGPQPRPSFAQSIGIQRGFDFQSAAISGAFPLLFGQGPIASLAGGLGGGVGGMFGGMGGFAGGIAATAAVQSIQNAVNGVAKLGQAFNKLNPDIDPYIDFGNGNAANNIFNFLDSLDE